MTPGAVFKAALGVLGLSQAEAAAYLDVSISNVEKMCAGKRRVPRGIWSELADLWDRQTIAEQEALDLIDELHEAYSPEALDLRATGAHGEWPSPGCAAAVAARIVMESRVSPVSSQH